jgi:hypothetical protein
LGDLQGDGMGYRDDRESIGGHISGPTTETACRNTYEDKKTIRKIVNTWYNCLKNIYKSSYSILQKDKTELKEIDKLIKKFDKYFKELHKTPEMRDIKLHTRILEDKCMDILDLMHIKLHVVLQSKFEMFYRTREKEHKPIRGLEKIIGDTPGS